MNDQYYANFLIQAHEAVVQKRRGMLECGVLFFQDNAHVYAARVARHVLTVAGFTKIGHSLYSPDLAPSDCSAFLILYV